MNAPRRLQDEIEGPKISARDAMLVCAGAAACLGEGDFQGAEIAAKAAIAADRESFEAWAILGVSFAKQKYFRLAAECFERALALRPNDVESWVWLGESMISMLDYEGAATALRRALQLDPQATHPAGRRARAVVGRTIRKLSQG
jgi:cytochrome c-type biogenesis protein CcmH/NrfG